MYTYSVRRWVPALWSFVSDVIGFRFPPGWSLTQAAAALAIFEDLAFLNFEQSTMWVDPHPQKSDLGESSIYTALQKGW